jgi:DNA-binding transcriptional MerR regulator
MIAPVRNDLGYRLYTEEHVKILKWLMKKVNKGFTIGQAVTLLENENINLEQENFTEGTQNGSLLEELLDTLLSFNELKAQGIINTLFSLFTIEKVIFEIFCSLLIKTGELRETGKISSAQEQYIVAYIRSRIDSIFHSLPQNELLPKAILVCYPGEYHEIGLLMFSLFLNGSRDSTFAALRKMRCMLLSLKIVRLKRNFGQTAALAAGLAYANGDIIVLMDGDRQNDPADIPALIGMLEEGNDLVAGWRYNRRDAFFSRRLPSMLANCLISSITSVKLHDYGCTLKAMRKEVAKNLKLYGEMHRFIPAIAYERGAQIAEIKVKHRPRLAGQSKYGISRTLRVILDLLTVKFLSSYSTRPAHVFGPLGVVSGVTGFALALYLSVE